MVKPFASLCNPAEVKFERQEAIDLYINYHAGSGKAAD